MGLVTKGRDIHKGRYTLLELHMISFLSPLEQKKNDTRYSQNSLEMYRSSTYLKVQE